jgi:hypothetical protein
VVRALILRGIVLWFLTRLMASAVLSGASTQGAILPLWAVAVTASLVRLDLSRRKELILLHNLGATTSHVVLIGSIPALLFEGAIAAFRA